MADVSPATEPAKPRVFSGIRASGDKTLGNYSGGYRQYAATQRAVSSVCSRVSTVHGPAMKPK